MTALNGIAAGGIHPPSGSFNDPSKQTEIYQYLEALKKDEMGWKKSADNIVTNNLSNVEEHFLLLQVVEDYLSRRYCLAADNDCVMCVRNLLMHWIERITASPEQPTFLVNKMAHIFSLVFAIDFPDRWPSFMEDIFLRRGFGNIPITIFYLKTLLAIDSEVVDRDIQRSKQVFDRNTKIKDYMREICIQQMVESWYSILNTISDVTTQCLCLDVIAAYVDWIDVELVANDVFVPVVIARLSNTETIEPAVHAVSALIQKGMIASKKLPLVNALVTVLKSNQLLTVNENSDEDAVLRAGSLLNSIGTVLVDCISKFRAEQNQDDAERCLELLESNLDSTIQVLDNEDPDLSELVFSTVRQYVQLIRSDERRDAAERDSVLSKVVAACLGRYIMNDDLNVDGEGEDELDFREYRKNLRTILNSVGTKRPELIISPLEGMVENVLANRSGLGINQVEAAMQLVHDLSELIPSNFVQCKDGWLGRAAQIPVNLLSRLHLDSRSSSVHMLYFEIACRYERLLAQYPQPVISHVAAAFLDERGIAFPSPRVRTRIVYLFCRFVKAHKVALSPLVSEVISRLAPLLAVSPQSEQFLSPDDQGFIFEATAILIVFGNLEISQKADYIRELATTLGTKFQSSCEDLKRAREQGNDAAAKIIAQFMCNIVGYCSRMSKAFNNLMTMRSCQCFEIYINLLNLFLESLTSENRFLLEPIRQLGHRLVVCLEKEVLPILPCLLAKLSEVSLDLDSMNHLLILCHQVVAKHKKDALSSGVDFGAILTTAARFSVEPCDQPQDEAAQRNITYVRRAFLQLLYTTAASEMLSDVLPNENIFNGIMEAASRLALGSDQAAQKLALQSLCKVSLQSSSQWQRTLRTALEVPSLSHISISDAGSTLVVHEVSSTLNALRSANPQAFVATVQSLLPSEMCSSLLQLLDNVKSRDLDRQIMLLYAPFKAQPS